MADDDIEQIAVDHEVAPAVRAPMDGVLQHLDATEMGAVVIAQELVVIAGDVAQARALARLTQQLLHHVVVELRPIPARLQLPTVDDVADEINGIGLVMAEEVEEAAGLAAFGTEVDIGQKQRADLCRSMRNPLQHSRSCRRRFGLIGDFCCRYVTAGRGLWSPRRPPSGLSSSGLQGSAR